MGDMIATVGNDFVEGVKQKFNKETKNDCGVILTELCIQNELRINNMFFQHRPQYKYTWSYNQGRNYN